MPMHKKLSLTLLFLLLLKPFHLSNGDIGTAAPYSPPYLPTSCYGNDASQLPSDSLFAAPSEPIWDNGISCGNEFFVRCVSASEPGTCKEQTIKVKIVDHAPSSSATILLSTTAFELIANGSASLVNIEFQQV